MLASLEARSPELAEPNPSLVEVKANEIVDWRLLDWAGVRDDLHIRSLRILCDLKGVLGIHGGQHKNLGAVGNCCLSLLQLPSRAVLGIRVEHICSGSDDLQFIDKIWTVLVIPAILTEARQEHCDRAWAGGMSAQRR